MNAPATGPDQNDPQAPGTASPPPRPESRRRAGGVRAPALATLLVGFGIGVAFLAGGDAAIDSTNTLEFCTSCHEMREHVYPGYAQSAHFANRSGVRATCADCHVPREGLPRLWHKIQSVGELYAKLAGRIDSPEKYAARREVLAERVREEMRASDSRECRSCHTPEAMSEARQSEIAWGQHSTALAGGATCIDCHAGLVHGN